MCYIHIGALRDFWANTFVRDSNRFSMSGTSDYILSWNFSQLLQVTSGMMASNRCFLNSKIEYYE